MKLKSKLEISSTNGIDSSVLFDPKKAIPIDEREGEMAVRARDCTGEGADFRGQMGFEIGIRTH